MKTTYFGVNGVSTGFIVCAGEHGRVLHFVGESATPYEPPSPTAATLRGVWVENETSAWIAGDSGTVLRWDGRHWRQMAMASKHDDLLTVWSCCSEVWIGGKNFLSVYRPQGVGGILISTEHTIRSIWGSGPDDIWILADDAMVFQITASGTHNRAIDRSLGDVFNAIGGSGEEGDVYAVGELGLLVKWDGSEWRELDTGTEDNLLAVCGGDAGDAWIGTSGGRLLRYDGKECRPVAVSPFGRLNAVAIVDGTVWAAGDGAVILQHRPDDDGSKD